MLKMMVTGLVGVIAALVGAQFGYDILFAKQPVAKSGEPGEHLVTITTDLTGVPVVFDNAVAGYVVLRISSLVDPAQLPADDASAASFLVDAAFRATYGFSERGFDKMKPQDIKFLTDEIARLANEKLGSTAVHVVNLEQFNFVPKSDIRGKMLEPKHKS
jgi:hypothetical protein